MSNLGESNDLLLLSNIEDVSACHYMFNFKIHINAKVIFGGVFIFFDIPNKYIDEEIISENSLGKDSKKFNIILECCDINIESVEELEVEKTVVKTFMSRVKDNFEDYTKWNEYQRKTLEFIQDQNYLNIKKNLGFSKSDFPKVLFISYKTKPEGKSIAWRKDVENWDCLFTCGSNINNRSLFPYQDRSVAMSTWQAWVTVPKGYIVSMTGDKSELLLESNCFYYFTSMILPLCTISLAVGKWQICNVISELEALTYNKQLDTSKHNSTIFCKHTEYPCYLKERYRITGPLIPVTLLATEKQITKFASFVNFVRYILMASYAMIGKYPFERLEIVILPRCFSSLGLASPNVIYLSQSVCIDDEFFYIRLAHEVCHSWFGITIGPKNWSEEWLSEGFATFFEDHLFISAKNIKNTITDTEEHYERFSSLRDQIRYKTLLHENENSDSNMQSLVSDSSTENVIVNGLNPEKSFLQVHYLKGYFLLKYLQNFVGSNLFLEFLKQFLILKHGCLVTTSEFVDLFLQHFSPYKKVPDRKIITKFLVSCEVNEEIHEMFNNTILKNEVIENVNVHFRFWKSFNDFHSKKTSSKKLAMKFIQQKNSVLPKHLFEFSHQVVLLFEQLLSIENIMAKVLTHLYAFYKIKDCNAEIRHRWCELVIKHKYFDLNEVEKFLIEDQAMGIYLYGELLITENSKHLKLFKSTFKYLKNELDYNAKNVIKSMIEG